MRIVKILGALGGKYNSLLVDTVTVSEDTVDGRPKWMAWDRGTHLWYAVPFHDMKPRIALDPLMPRLIDLARTAPDRQTKACPPLIPCQTRSISTVCLCRLRRVSSCIH